MSSQNCESICRICEISILVNAIDFELAGVFARAGPNARTTDVTRTSSLGSHLKKRVSFRAEWSERSERNAVEESHKQSQRWESLRDSSTPLRPQERASLRSE